MVMMRLPIVLVVAFAVAAGCTDRLDESVDPATDDPPACEDIENSTMMTEDEDSDCPSNETTTLDPPSSSAMCLEGAEDCDDTVGYSVLA